MRTTDVNELVEATKVMGDEPVLPAFEFNALWRSAWLRAIACAWRDEDFKRRLLQAPTHEGTAPSTKQALGEAGLSFPDFFNKLLEIEVKELHEDSDKSFQPVKQGNGWKHFGSDLRARLTLTLPPRPERAEDFALALADYDAGGRVYPFSFC
jgi:ribosomally synthesized peptide (two-chain TOMM family)